MKYSILLVLALLLFSKCKECDSNDKHMGEVVVIPTQFVSFSTLEMSNMVVYRVDNANPANRDTLRLQDILTGYKAFTTTVQITDRAPAERAAEFDYYHSYFDNASIIIKWNSGSDTLSDFVVKKSRVETSNKCHKDDPNVKIDQFSFKHKGQTVSRNELIYIRK